MRDCLRKYLKNKILIVLCRRIRKRYMTEFIDALKLKFDLSSSLIHFKRLLLAWISLFTKPIALLSCIGAAINSVLFFYKTVWSAVQFDILLDPI